MCGSGQLFNRHWTTIYDIERCAIVIEQPIPISFILRKQSKLYPATACGDLPRTVHLQTCQGSTTDWGDTENCRTFDIYAKMLLPYVTTRMEQSSLSLAFLVLTCLKIRLEEVAGMAS